MECVPNNSRDAVPDGAGCDQATASFAANCLVGFFARIIMRHTGKPCGAPDKLLSNPGCWRMWKACYPSLSSLNHDGGSANRSTSSSSANASLNYSNSIVADRTYHFFPVSSLRLTMRLRMTFSGVESRSSQKNAVRRPWKRTLLLSVVPFASPSSAGHGARA